MINLICGRYYDGPDDDLILLPTIVYANAKAQNRRSRAIALTWLNFGIGIVFHNQAASEFLKLKRTA